MKIGVPDFVGPTSIGAAFGSGASSDAGDFHYLLHYKMNANYALVTEAIPK